MSAQATKQRKNDALLSEMKVTAKECLCLAAGLLVVVASLRMGINADHYLSTRRSTQINIATTQAVGIVLWPCIWNALIGFDMLSSVPLAALGLAWPIVLLLLDLLWISHQTAEHEGVNKKTVFHFDSGRCRGSPSA